MGDHRRGRGNSSGHGQLRRRDGYSYHGGAEREDHNSSHYASQYDGAAYGTSYNYWQDGYNEDRRSRYSDSTYSGQYHGSRASSPTPGQYPWHQHYSTLQTPSETMTFLVPPTFCPNSPLAGPSIPETAPPPPDPPKPDPAYLSLSQEPSIIIQEPSSSRKLLVLDLNGTLLIRSQHSAARFHTSSGQRVRAVQPRPYMPSFREYLFAPETKAWLDTMVWSSAQPHSVDDMVDRVFGSYKGDLRAVWTRRSLGLSAEEYRRKTLTTKDLTKPWKLLALGVSPEEYKEQPPASPPAESESQIIHSALTTLLLDDSPHKALLQPYNHICIPEYDSARRQADLLSIVAMRQPKESKQSKKRKLHNEVEAVDCIDLASPHLDAVSDSPSSARPASPDLAAKEPFDVTLLAVIGIIDAVKFQSNVAGWVRGGGLWVAQEKSAEVGTAEDVEELSVGSTSPTTSSDDRPVRKRKRTKSQKMAAQGGPGISDKADTTTIVQTGNDASTTSDPAVTPTQAHLEATMWFNGPSTLAHWVARGRKALNELGIDVSHGVTG
ncbi:hypothetical protein PAXRUDRAFT_325246 [Paxillus rubicundulus Ve08.2h10]|uniref:Mitochondrial import inner membrane translocase subunit TIM50 n=1 Tax=Paxillus rubicundulus Ve08.2h10 TaxID=930991 RepID=A0A0D0CSY2_9AGAM|nr:hypothetical protein PAXRUDRAFT_325246 [Paxillus rubicundulus Ve08.2h10]